MRWLTTWNVIRSFLPWCAKTELRFRDEQKTVATLHIDFLSVKSHFTTEEYKIVSDDHADETR